MTPAKRKPFDISTLNQTVILTHEDMLDIGRMLHRNISDKDSLLAAISALNSVNVEGQTVRLEPGLLTRLKSRCLDKGRFGPWLAETIVKQLHDYAGW